MATLRNPITLLCLALSCSLMLGAAAGQQPLTQLAPPDTALLVTLQTGTEFAPDLREELSQLDWQVARETLETFLAAVDPASMSDLADLRDFSGFRDALAELCPALPDTVETLGQGDGPPGFEALLTVQPGLFDVPVTVVVRFEDLTRTGLRSLEQTLSECSDQTRTFEELDVSGSGQLFEITPAETTFYVALTDSGLLVVGKDLMTSVVPALERANGTGASLAESDPLTAFEAVDGYSLAIALRTDPLLEAYGDLLTEAGPGEQEVALRIRDAVDTLDSIAWRGSLTSEGVLNELALAIDPDRPDPGLARLLLCEGCGLARPYLAPTDVASFSSSPIPLARVVDYVEGFLASSVLLETDLGFTLDPALLDALGTGTYMYTLETIGTDLYTLLYQPGRVLVVPVSSAEAFREELDPLLGSIRSLVTQSVPEFPVAIRQAEYRGLEYRRLQTSLNVDLGIGLVGDNLVIAMPSQAIESAVDTYLGGPSLVGSERYREVVALAPRDALGLSWQDTPASLSGVADLLRLASQPVAFAAHLALQESQAESDFDVATADDFLSPRVLLPDEWQALAPGTIEGVLSDDPEELDPYVGGDLSDVYRLEGIAGGDEVSVVLQSDEFDTMLYLLDGEGTVVASNDDSPDTSRSEVVFAVQPGTDYFVQATSYWGDALGAYVLTVERTEGQGAIITAPVAQLLMPGETTGELDSADAQVDGKLSDLYELEGLTAGDEVTVSLESGQFDTMLYLRDAGGQAILSNDDAPDTSRSEVRFVVEEGATYRVQATSYLGNATGDYLLAVETGPAPVVVEPPEFEELLSLFEMPAKIFEALARNTGATTGYAVKIDDVLYTRGFTGLR